MSFNQVAQADDRAFFIAPQISILGVGIETGYRFDKYIGLRAAFDYLSFSETLKTGGVKYNTSAQLKSFGLPGDIYPFGESFRITGGFRANYNQGIFSADLAEILPAVDPTLNAREFGRLSGKVEFPHYAPYAGIGWSTTLFRNDIYSGADLGVMFQGRGTVVQNSDSSMPQ